MPDFKPHFFGVAALSLTCAAPVFADQITEFPVACAHLIAGANEGTDCIIYHGDEENRGVVFDFSDDGRELTVLQVTDDGVIEQENAPLEIGYADAIPTMIDLNGDGFMEILIPAGSHADDIGYEVWTESPDSPLFVHFSGLVMTALPEDLTIIGDLIVYSNRWATEQIMVHALHMTASDIWPAYDITVSVAFESTCDVSLGEAGRDLGLDAAALKEECEALKWN